jgi:hypothetical protein
MKPPTFSEEPDGLTRHSEPPLNAGPSLKGA